MTNEEVMAMMADMGLHEGGMDNWVTDNAWVNFANVVYEQAFVNGMQKQMQSSVDKAVSAMTQPEQKPMHPEMRKMWEDHFDKCFRDDQFDKCFRAQPPQRTWVGLTDGVMCDIAIEHGLMSIDWIDFARAIEAKLKEKNFD